MIVFSIIWICLIIGFYAAAKFILRDLSEKQYIEVLSNPILVRRRSRSLKKTEIGVLIASILVAPMLANMLSRLIYSLQDYLYGGEYLVFFAGRQSVWLACFFIGVGCCVLLMLLAAKHGRPLPENDWQRQPMLWEARRRAKRMKYWGLAIAFFVQLVFMLSASNFTRITEKGIEVFHGNFSEPHIYALDEVTRLHYYASNREEGVYEPSMLMILGEKEIDLWDKELSQNENKVKIDDLIEFLGRKEALLRPNFEVIGWPPKDHESDDIKEIYTLFMPN